jgi:hypothetical protein
MIPNLAFSSHHTECPGDAYGPCDGIALRPGFADQRFRRILSTSRSAPFLRPEGVRIRWRSSRTLFRELRSAVSVEQS